MGVSIVAAKGAGQSNLGIYVKSVVKGGPAEMSGRLAAGDQLLSVDGHSLVGLSQDSAAAIMMRTGPVVSLQVEKFAASYQGLGNLLNESPPENETSSSHLRLDGVSALYCVVDLSPSERNHGGHKRKMQKYRQLYRSNPNVTAGFCPEDGGELFDRGMRGNGFSSVSSDNLCADTHPREYLTLPNPKSKDKSVFEPTRSTPPFTMSVTPSSEQSDSRRGFMRRAASQESLCADGGGPLLGQKQNACTQRSWSSSQSTNFCRSVALRSSVSTHDIPSDHKQPSRAGFWRNPFSQRAVPTPSVRPIRIDIPVARAGGVQSNPPLTTFQQSPCVLNRLLKASEQRKSSQSSVCPSSTAKALLQPSGLWQQQRSEKPRVCITPTKHVSFQEPPSEQKGQSDTRVLLCDPWRREAQEALEKQQRLEAVERLEREAQQLRAKEQRSAEEDDRLQRLDLEWRFQKRLQEIQQRGEEEEEEDLDVMAILQQLDRTSEIKIGSVGNIKTKQNEEEKHGGNQHSYKQEGKPDQRKWTESSVR